MRSLAAAVVVALPLGLASCADECSMAGKSTVSYLDGRVLSLRAMDGNDVDVDTCRVIHGNFNFYRDVDSVYIATIAMGGQSIMPVVIEQGNLRVTVDGLGQRVSGGKMNDKLYKYIREQERIYRDWQSLQAKYMQLLRDGHSLEEIESKLGRKLLKNSQKSEDLETKFIVENSDNVLGRSYFRMMCEGQLVPVLTEQMAKILETSDESLLHDPWVRSYLRVALHNPASVPLNLRSKN